MKAAYRLVLLGLLGGALQASAQAVDPDAALFQCVVKHDVPCALAAIKNGANVDRIGQFGTPGKGQTLMVPLIEVVKTGNLDMLQLFIEKKASVKLRDHDKRTALMHAAELGQRDMVMLLLLNKADPRDKDKDGNTAVSLARAKGHEEIVKALIQRLGQLQREDKE